MFNYYFFLNLFIHFKILEIKLLKKKQQKNELND